VCLRSSGPFDWTMDVKEVRLPIVVSSIDGSWFEVYSSGIHRVTRSKLYEGAFLSTVIVRVISNPLVPMASFFTACSAHFSEISNRE